MESWAVILLVIFTTFCVVRILQCYGVFEKTKGVDSLSRDIRKRQKNQSDIEFERWVLKVFEGTCNMFGAVALSASKRTSYRFYIDRLDIRSEVLDRPYTPEELKGRDLCIMLVGLALVPLAFVFPLVLLGTGVCVFNYVMGESFLKQRVADEDKIIDDHFIDLYLMLHPKLKKGSKARLAPTVDTYVKSLDMTEDAEVAKVMKKFGMFFLNNLSLYEDHVAVPMLKERYRSATIVNFCNVATQALQGVANEDILLSTRMELIRKKKIRATEIAEKRAEKAQKSVFLIFVNLFIFVILSWVSKLPKFFF